MAIVQTKQRIANEVSLLASEVANRYFPVWEQKRTKRFRFLAAQASVCMHFMKITSEVNDDWGWFPDFLDVFRQEALSGYREAREDDDQDLALSMLARLRLSTTLARRLADCRRTSLFARENDQPHPMHVENMWVREMTLMMEEAMANHQRVESQGNRIRSLMALAPLFLATELLKNIMDSEDWSGIKDTVYDYIDSETERYRQARAAGDRDNASVMLARVRFSKTLVRRFENPERRSWLAGIFRGSDTKH